jgi:hypothetical protein
MAENAAGALNAFSPWQSSKTVNTKTGLVGVKDRAGLPYLKVQTNSVVDPQGGTHRAAWCLLWGSNICQIEEIPNKNLRFSVGAGLVFYRPHYRTEILDTINGICNKIIHNKPFDISEDILYYHGNPLLSDSIVYHYCTNPTNRASVGVASWSGGYLSDSDTPLMEKDR